MRIGILLFVDKFMEEAIVLDNWVDFIEVILAGKEGVSSLLGSRYNLLAHLCRTRSHALSVIRVGKASWRRQSGEQRARNSLAFRSKSCVVPKLSLLLLGHK